MKKAIVLTFISLALELSQQRNEFITYFTDSHIDTGEFPFYQNRSRKVIPPIATR